MANEKRLIDANVLIEDLEAAEANAGMGAVVARTLIRYVKRCATVDAVEVVRCKDCKYYKEGELLAPNKFCFRLKHPTENRQVGYNFHDDDFCSYGERKTDG